MKKKIIIITIIAIVILLCVIFMKPISFYVTILSNGYNPTQVENYKTTEKSQHGKSNHYIVKGKEDSFNLILLSNEQSLFLNLQKLGIVSTATKPYSWLKWDEWLIEENGDLSTRAHKTIIFKTESKVQLDTEKEKKQLLFKKGLENICQLCYNDR